MNSSETVKRGGRERETHREKQNRLIRERIQIRNGGSPPLRQKKTFTFSTRSLGIFTGVPQRKRCCHGYSVNVLGLGLGLMHSETHKPTNTGSKGSLNVNLLLLHHPLKELHLIAESVNLSMLWLTVLWNIDFFFVIRNVS